MDATIVLHGLFLLRCLSAGGLCQIWIAKPDNMGMPDGHLYKVGYGIDLVDIPDKDLGMAVPSTGSNSLTPASATPFSSGYSSREFKLCGKNSGSCATKLTLDPHGARSMITVPWPDEILGAHQISIDAHQFLGGDSAAEVESPSGSDPVNPRYVISETVILHYKMASNFDLLLGDGRTVLKSSVLLNTPTSADASRRTNVLVLYSWPPDCLQMGEHSQGFNDLWSDSSGRHPKIHFTGNPMGSITSLGNETGVDQLGLPPEVLNPPCISTIETAPSVTSAARKALTIRVRKENQGGTKKKPAKNPSPQFQVIIFTATSTGCGVVSGDDGN